MLFGGHNGALKKKKNEKNQYGMIKKNKKKKLNKTVTTYINSLNMPFELFD